MKKNIYGIIDTRTGNFGDICILDRDEEFRDGCLTLFSNTDIPDYILSDLLAYRYGSVSYDSDMLFPKFDILTFPLLILSGDDAVRQRQQSNSTADAESLCKDDVLRDTVSENS